MFSCFMTESDSYRIEYTVYNSANFFAVRKPELQGQTVEVKQPISQVYTRL